MSDLLLSARGLVKEFPGRGGVRVHAVAGVDLDVARGETLALVGESGSGKTTTARMVLGLLAPTAGTVTFDGQNLASLARRELRVVRRRLQVVFQDPLGALDPRWRVGAAIAEPLRLHGSLTGAALAARVAELLERVGLAAALGARYPHELSGGERQRVCIARALATEPDLVVLDEPVSALDVSVQAGIVELLGTLQRELGIAYLLIAHDLGLVRRVARRVAVMHLGRIVEEGAVDDVFGRARHPYTQALLSAVPRLGDGGAWRRRIRLAGEPPSALAPPSGCRFRTRCWLAEDACAASEPALAAGEHGHAVACHLA